MGKTKIYLLRKSHGINQESMGKILGMSKQSYARFEKGIYNNDTIIALVKFADYFGVTVDYLLDKNDEIENEICSLLKTMTDTQKEWALNSIKGFIEALQK